MNSIYEQHPTLYEAMYHSFINYKEEYHYYFDACDMQLGDTVVEIGCGTGNLYPYFADAGLNYIGIDLNATMLNLASAKHPQANWIVGDMCNFTLLSPVDHIIITARTVSYLATNAQFLQMLDSCKSNLKPNGTLAFDFIDASWLMPYIGAGKTLSHTATSDAQVYERISHWTVDGKESWSFRWVADYYEIKDGVSMHLATDDSVVRSFTEDDVRIMFSMASYKSVSFAARQAYTFETLVAIAKR